MKCIPCTPLLSVAFLPNAATTKRLHPSTTRARVYQTDGHRYLALILESFQVRRRRRASIWKEPCLPAGSRCSSGPLCVTPADLLKTCSEGVPWTIFGTLYIIFCEAPSFAKNGLPSPGEIPRKGVLNRGSTVHEHGDPHRAHQKKMNVETQTTTVPIVTVSTDFGEQKREEQTPHPSPMSALAMPKPWKQKKQTRKGHLSTIPRRDAK